MYTNSVYPAVAGTKDRSGASLEAARAVDRDPERKYTAMVNIVLEALTRPNVPDEIAKAIGESILYTRPLCSTLIALGLVRKGPIRNQSIHGRPAHVIKPSTVLIDALQCEFDVIAASGDVYDAIYDLEPEEVCEVRALVQSLIVTRVLEARKAGRANRGGVDA